MKKIIAVIITNIILFSCDSEPNITSFKIKNPYSNQNIKENVSISIFKGDGGGIEQNVNRWRGQLNLPEKKIQNINSKTINSPFLGDFYLFHEFNPYTNKAIIGAIMPYKDETIFIKINTSETLSDERQYELELFCQSLYFDENKNLMWNAPKNWKQKPPGSNLNVAYFEIN